MRGFCILVFHLYRLMRISLLILLTAILLFSCADRNEKYSSYSKGLKKPIYDSVQSLVKYGKEYWPDHKFYLLESLTPSKGSIELKLTLLPKEIERRFLSYCYLYNEDSTLLLVAKNNPFLSKLVNTRLRNVIDTSIVKDSVFVIFNPPIWKLTIINNKIIVDRNYSEKEARKRVVDSTIALVAPKGG